jgi:PAS domain S-box-containing protein
MDAPTHILIIADPPSDVELVRRAARRALPTSVFERAETREEYLAALERFQPDLIICGYGMPRFDAITALRLAAAHAPLVPVIILASALNEQTAVQCMKAGAADYVTKEHIKRLGPAITQALDERRRYQERQQSEEALRASEAHIRSVYENATVGLYRITPDGHLLMANPAAVRMLGYPSFEALAQRYLEQEGFVAELPRGAYRAQLDRDGVMTGLESVWTRRDGSSIVVRASERAIRDEQGVVRYYDGTFEDISEQKRMQEALHLTQFCVDNASVGIVRIGSDAQILSVNNEMCRLLGYTSEELCTMRIIDIDPNFPIERWNFHRRDLQARGSSSFESTHRRKDGRLFPVEITNTYLEFQGNGFAISFVRDISDRQQAVDTQARLEQQLLQSQKMESIGRLAGGVAHDFNNLLTVIQGYCDLMEETIPRESPLLEELEQIRLASQRAADLTGQLLAFSRKQILRPSILALNDLVANMRKMLERLIGEDITLMTMLEPDLHPLIADRGQIEQVIMNLVINARDAMPTGGTLIIETANVEVDERYAITHPEAPVGPCVALIVTDTGSGMDEITQARVFEPFFTTKVSGQGTGLGLATVYGIIKQSGGEVTFASRPEHGTTFQILLPASPRVTGEPAEPQPRAAASGGHETILLAEDEVLVRDLVRTVLRSEGYTILEAAHGQEALAIARQHQGSIDLLITDVVMPRMSGRELAAQLSLERKQIKVLFMSGYTDDAVVRHGLLMARVEFLAKPFSPSKLAAKVREVLDKSQVADFQATQAYYQAAHGTLTRTLDISHGAANTRSFAQLMVAQGNVLAIMGDLAAAGDHFTRARAIFEALGDQNSQVAVLERLGWVAREQGDAPKASARLEEGLTLSRKVGDRQQTAWLLLTMAEVAIVREDAASAEALVEQGRALSPESYDWAGWSLNHLGHAAQLRREYSRAEQMHQKTLAVFVERLGDKSIGVLWAYHGLGETALGRGDPATARSWLRTNLRLCGELGTRIMTAWCLAGLGTAAALDEDPERAVRLWGAAEQLRAALGCRPAPAARATYERQLVLTRSLFGEGVFAGAWAAGQAMSLEQAIAEALGDQS